MAETRIIKRIWNPAADEWLELPKPIALAGAVDMESFVAGYQQRLAEEQVEQPEPDALTVPYESGQGADGRAANRMPRYCPGCGKDLIDLPVGHTFSWDDGPGAFCFNVPSDQP